MNKIICTIALGASFLLLLPACKKNNSNNSGPYTSMASVFSAQAVQPKTVTIDPTINNSFYGTSGTRYILSANSLQTATGAAVTGSVQVQVAEYLQKGDMIFSKMLPISDGQPLISGGEINISATQDGQPVYLKPGYTFQVNMPEGGTAPTGMSFFAGTLIADSLATNTNVNTVNWVQKKDTVETTFAIGDSLSIISDSLRLCNADGFMSNPSYQTFTVKVTGVSIPSTAYVLGYTLYDDYKGVWPLGAFTGGYSSTGFSETHVPNIPVHFVVFTFVNGDFYGGTLGSITPATGSIYTVNLAKVDPIAFKASLNAL